MAALPRPREEETLNQRDNVPSVDIAPAVALPLRAPPAAPKWLIVSAVLLFCLLFWGLVFVLGAAGLKGLGG